MIRKYFLAGLGITIFFFITFALYDLRYYKPPNLTKTIIICLAPVIAATLNGIVQNKMNKKK